ncbi:MAG: GNAT family N-acetyltransferase [Deltaproteobacteria bacterium]|nr:GNAT family N-acetyltransferase [Deltaproteobacteria bacterium]
MLEVRPVSSDHDLEQILALQRQNLARSLTSEQVSSEGFVTVEHTLEALEKMHALEPSIVAVDGAALVGYALVMPVACRAFLPILEPMFERFEALGLMRERFYVMGQICVAESWRGRGVFDLLYQGHRDRFRGHDDSVITEVATRNTRSMRAHERVGFKVIDRYRDATDEWAIIRWDWS